MTNSEFMRELTAIHKHYDKIEKNWMQSTGDMHLAIKQERDDAINRLVDQYHAEAKEANNGG